MPKCPSAGRTREHHQVGGPGHDELPPRQQAHQPAVGEDGQVAEPPEVPDRRPAHPARPLPQSVVNVFRVHGQLECGELLDGPAALERIQGEHRVIAVLNRASEEHLVHVRVQVVADDRCPVHGEGAPVDEDISRHRQDAALGHLPSDLANAAYPGQEVGVGVIGDFHSGDGLDAAVRERLQRLLNGIAFQCCVGVERAEDVGVGGTAERDGLGMPLAAVLGTDPGEPHVRRHARAPVVADLGIVACRRAVVYYLYLIGRRVWLNRE